MPVRLTKSGSSITAAERDIIQRVVEQQPNTALTERQVTGLAHALRRKPDTVKAVIEDARHELAMRTPRYMDVHMQATEGALRKEDFDTAGKLAQWALENVSEDGQRVVEKGQGVPGSGVQVMIGLNLPGMPQPTLTILPDVDK